MIMRSFLKIMTLAFLAFTLGCSPATFTKLKDEITTEILVEKDTVEELDINIELGYGMINIASGANEFVEGNVTYDIAELKPNVSYKYRRKSGKTSINQPNTNSKKLIKGKLKNNWDLQLTNDLPVDLSIDTGASKTDMDLRGMHLRKLNIDAGVGSTTINLGGTWPEDVDVDLDIGVGETTIVLPKEVGVKVKADKGLGATNFTGLISKNDGIYVNDAYGTSNITMTINTDVGIGEANFKLEK